MVTIASPSSKLANSRLTKSAVLVSLSLILNGPAVANEQTPQDHLADATKSLAQALQLLLQTIPQFEAPEILENGDIIIRRKRPDSTEPGPQDPETDDIKT